ncbi:hypothetical protein IWW48_005167 [Coemansia sp. RSA 1200]|nr:hypothetical protein IWW48_005167 [Coemansia sp. RSA 1200]
MGTTEKGLRRRLSSQQLPKAKPIPYKIVEETLGLVSNGLEAPTSQTAPPIYEPRMFSSSHASPGYLSVSGQDGNPASQSEKAQDSYNRPCWRHDADDTARNIIVACNSGNSEKHVPAPLLTPFAAPTDIKNSAALDDATYAERLFTVNQYLLRRIRKLELTNQIIREAYTEVQEILEAERQSKTTQMGALEKKHDEELNDLYAELTERKEGHRDSFNINLKSLTDSGSDSDSDYGFRPGFSTVMTNEPRSISATAGGGGDDVEFIRSSDSSPISHSRNDALSPPRTQRSVSDLTGLSLVQRGTKVNSINAVPAELEIEFLEPGRADGDHGSESDQAEDEDHNSVCSDSDSGSDDGSGTDEDDASHKTKPKQRPSQYSCIFDVGMVEFASPHNYKEKRQTSGQLDAEFNSDFEADADTESDDGYSNTSEDDDGDSVDFDSDIDDNGLDSDVRFIQNSYKGDVHTLSFIFADGTDTNELSDGESEQDDALQLLTSPNDHLSVDPAKAVLRRYYSSTGILSLDADIDDLPEDYEENGADIRFRSGDGDDAARMELTDASIDLESHSPWSVGECHQVVHPGSGEKSFDEREMEHIAQLPPDQRIAKFVYRASSHLLQGVRGGLSLGFMLHNLEALAEKFTSNHASILCAFVESLYQIVEQFGQPGTEEGQSEDNKLVEDASEQPKQQQQQQQRQYPRSALSKRVPEEMYSPQQAARRVAKLLHTFITLPEDQRTVLYQLEQLAEANSKVRLFKHALLLRILHECELVDRDAIDSWYSSLQQQQQQQQPDSQSMVDSNGVDSTEDAIVLLPLELEHSQLLRRNATPFIVELANDNNERDAGGSRISLDELHQQIQQFGGASSNTMSLSSSTSSSAASLSFPGTCDMPLPAPCGHFAGTTTPVSEENSTLNSHSSECEFVGVSKTGGSTTIGNSSTASILAIGRRAGSRSLSSAALGTDHLTDHYNNHCTPSSALGGTSGNLKPTKQVTFATG